MTNEELQRMGANARAVGKSEFDNPYYRVEMSPLASGMDPREWARREENWRIGWTVENLMRPSSLDTLLSSLTR